MREKRHCPQFGLRREARGVQPRNDWSMFGEEVVREPYAVTPVGVVWVRVGIGGESVTGKADFERWLEFPPVRSGSSQSSSHTLGVWEALSDLKCPPGSEFGLARIRFDTETRAGWVSPLLHFPSGRHRPPTPQEVHDWGGSIRALLDGAGVPGNLVVSWAVAEVPAGPPVLLLSPVPLSPPVWGHTPEDWGTVGRTGSRSEPVGVAGAQTENEGGPEVDKSAGGSEADKSAGGSVEVEESQRDVDTIELPKIWLGRGRRTRGRLRGRPILVATTITVLLLILVGALHSAVAPVLDNAFGSRGAEPQSASQLVEDAAPCPSLKEAAILVADLLHARGDALEQGEFTELVRVQRWDLALIDAADIVRRTETGEEFTSPTYLVEVNSLRCVEDVVSVVATVAAVPQEAGESPRILTPAVVHLNVQTAPPRILSVEEG